ncbi:MAG: Unknown protein [uncultured Thiotrichaceae bacterium]|uniref:Uncharacterized protein n=1 Tax=uncultured Thiotrichaceae bacterium TaxID=298394 RepID=A0A6S6SJJ6_9GAMM|nr:MAG: Unknown protein [uncultured Thiotrichaceae bacterium]
MASTNNLKWLDEDTLSTNVARRFAVFCKEDIQDLEKLGVLEPEVYEAAVRRIIEQFESKGKESKA